MRTLELNKVPVKVEKVKKESYKKNNAFRAKHETTERACSSIDKKDKRKAFVEKMKVLKGRK